jgi:CRISPR-associated exonuclease Cas4
MPAPESEPIPLSALQHAVYCLRQAALIHLERLWEENRFTAEGRVLHQVADKPGGRQVRGVRRQMALPLACRRLNLAGVADVVEFHREGDGEVPFPVEFKRGKPKAHQADEVQLCAQALCLEEMFGCAVPAGALFYGETRRRQDIAFDAALRSLTESTALALAEIFRTQRTPPARYKASLCRACSLLELCRPQLSGRSALQFRRAQVEALTTGDAAP